MHRLNDHRVGHGDPTSLIIPIFFRGDFEAAKTFAGDRRVWDFSTAAEPKTQLDTVRWLSDIRKIADSIDACVQEYSAAEECDDYEIQEGEEHHVVSSAQDPSPFGST